VEEETPEVGPDGFIMGVASHLMWSRARPSDGKGLAEIAITEMGVQSLRDEASWGEMDEPNWTTPLQPVAEHGGKVMLLLDYGNRRFMEGGGFPDTKEERAAFLQYASTVVTKVGPENLSGVEVWNEWDIYMGWPQRPAVGSPCPTDPQDKPGCPMMYVDLVEAMLYPERVGIDQPSFREAAPGVPVIVNAISARNPEWTETVMTEMGKRGIEVDGAVVHPYVHAPDGCPGSSSAPAGADVAANCVHLVAEEVAEAYGSRVPVYVTEVGWSSYDFDGGVSERGQAVNLVELYVRVRATGDVGGVWWYDLINDDGHEDPAEAQFGLMRRADPNYHLAVPGELKPSGRAFAALAGFWNECHSVDGSYKADNREFTVICPDEPRQIILDAEEDELDAAIDDGGTLVDLLGDLPESSDAADVPEFVGRPVGVLPAA